MKSLIKTTALSLLTATSLFFNFANQAEALTNHQPSIDSLEIKNETIDYSYSEEVTNELGIPEQQEVAYSTYCETRWYNGMWVKCCIDSYGRWACVY
jgi:hypothetical protein